MIPKRFVARFLTLTLFASLVVYSHPMLNTTTVLGYGYMATESDESIEPYESDSDKDLLVEPPSQVPPLPGEETGFRLSIIFPEDTDGQLYIEEGREFDLLYGVHAIDDLGFEIEGIEVIVYDDGGFYESDLLAGSIYTVVYAAKNLLSLDFVAVRERLITILEDEESSNGAESWVEIFFPEDGYDIEVFYVPLDFEEDEYGELIARYDLLNGVYALYFESKYAAGEYVFVHILNNSGFTPNAGPGEYFIVTYAAINPYTDGIVTRQRVVAQKQLEDNLVQSDSNVVQSFNVTGTGNGTGAGTLRWAIAQANAINTGPDEWVLINLPIDSNISLTGSTVTVNRNIIFNIPIGTTVSIAGNDAASAGIGMAINNADLAIVGGGSFNVRGGHGNDRAFLSNNAANNGGVGVTVTGNVSLFIEDNSSLTFTGGNGGSASGAETVGGSPSGGHGGVGINLVPSANLTISGRTLTANGGTGGAGGVVALARGEVGGNGGHGINIPMTSGLIISPDTILNSAGGNAGDGGRPVVPWPRGRGGNGGNAINNNGLIIHEGEYVNVNGGQGGRGGWLGSLRNSFPGQAGGGIVGDGTSNIPMADYTEVEHQIARFRTHNQEDYEEESWEDAEIAERNITWGLPSGRQPQVDAYAVALREAIDALIPLQVTLTFYGNGGTLDEGTNYRILTRGDSIGAVNAPTFTRYGYTFIGWLFNDEIFVFESNNTPVMNHMTFVAQWEEGFGFSVGTLNFGKLTLTIDTLLSNQTILLGDPVFTANDGEVQTLPSDTAISFTGITNTGWSIGVRAEQHGNTDFYKMLRVNGNTPIYDNNPHQVYIHETGTGSIDINWETLGFGVQIPNDTGLSGNHQAQLVWTHQPIVTDIIP